MPSNPETGATAQADRDGRAGDLEARGWTAGDAARIADAEMARAAQWAEIGRESHRIGGLIAD